MSLLRSPFARAVAALALAALGATSTHAERLEVQPSALKQVAALRQVKTSRTAAAGKLDSRLWLGVLNARRDPRVAVLTDFRFVRNESDGRVPVQIVVRGAAGVKPVLSLLETLGAQVTAASRAFGVVSARVALGDLEAVAALPEVRRVRQRIPPLFHAINVSEGDATHGAQTARNVYGVTGAGVKVCVLSDGVDSLAAVQATGDLPAVDVLPGQEGSGDEGTAMLEIVHDLAPGATLGFATAVTDEASFAQNILDLAADGCNIIVDDIIYLDESPFQDGPVAQSVNTVTGAGVLYFSSAGNEGNADDLTAGTWEGDFTPSAASVPGPLAGGNLHDFGDGGNSILVEFGGGNPPLLIWAEHYDLATGNASTDFDLYDMDGGLTTIFDASTDTQDGAGGDDWPIEFIGGGTFGGERLLIDKYASGSTSSQPAMNLIVFRGELDDALVTGGATRGHSAAAAAFSVAATPAAASFDGITPDGPYPGLFTAANESESFTSDGPRRILLDPAGAELTPGNRTASGGVVRQKPDITAADGVSTAAPGFNPFYGTSAAAPHAAAIAALLKSAVPSLTPAQVRTHLVNTAIDIEAAGTDRDTGAGIVMPGAALVDAGATPQAYLDAGAAVPGEAVGDGDAAIEPNEIWNFTLPLTNIGGAPATAISGTVTTSTPGVTVVAGNSSYPDLAASASGNNATPFTLQLGPSVPCGAHLQMTLTVTYTGGSASPQQFDFDLATGAPGTPQTFSYTNPVVPIPDGADGSGANPGAPAAATLPVAVAGNVYAATVSIDGTACSNTAGSTTVGIDHSFVNDLEITLVSPAATAVKLIDNTDGSGNNLCQTVLDDAAGPSIQTVTSVDAPFTGSFTPVNPLSTFAGESATGNWQLQAQDFFNLDTGNLRAFSITITPAICDAPALSAAVSAVKTVSGTFSVGGTVTYTITLSNSGSAAAPDNAGDEFTDTLPAQLTLTNATASSGTAAFVGNTATWNGPVPVGADTVTITLTATVNAGSGGQTVSNQASVSFDANLDGSNETTVQSDAPGGTAGDPTTFDVALQLSVVEIPTLSQWALAGLALALAGLGLALLRARG